MNDLYLDILYQFTLVTKLLEKEQNPIKIARYKGIQEALLYVLERI